jgi:hypothetical protein
MSAKGKAAGVNASSFWDLKAELAKHEAGLVAIKAAGGQLTLKGGVKRPEKVSSLSPESPEQTGLKKVQKDRAWERSNKGVAQRAAKDSTEWAKIERPTYEAAQAALARKAKVYQKLRKGQTGGLNDNQYDALLVDVSSSCVARTDVLMVQLHSSTRNGSTIIMNPTATTLTSL